MDSAADAFVVQEEPSEYLSKQLTPEPTLPILVLEEHNGPLYASVRALTSAGYKPWLVSQEDLAVTRILASQTTHSLLLTAHHTNRPLSVPQVIARLRRDRYDRPIVYCVKGEVSAEMEAAYGALSVDLTLALPARARQSILEALTWIAEQVRLDRAGLTILET